MSPFQVSEADVALERRVELRSGEVCVPLFGATDDAGVPDSVAQQMVDALESEVDFHRDLKRGDSFRVIYEALYAAGECVRHGRLLAVEFVNAGKRVDAYWHDDGRKGGSFFALDGRSTKRGFLRSPHEYTRVSSGFSASRTHPVFGYDDAHRGVDYAAPMGTKIRSVAAGSVKFAGWMNGYGNLVEIQHDSKHSKPEKDDYASRLKLYAAGLPYRDDASLEQRASALLAKGKFTEAEPVARECLALREKQIPDSWLAFDARSVLGGCLLGQKKPAEAEPLLLAGYQGMQQRESKIPDADRVRLKEALQRLVQLYEVTGPAGQAAEWKRKLTEVEESEPSDAALGAALERGKELCRKQRWQEAAQAFQKALNQPDFDWDLANQKLPLSVHWIGLALALRAHISGDVTSNAPNP